MRFDSRCGAGRGGSVVRSYRCECSNYVLFLSLRCTRAPLELSQQSSPHHRCILALKNDEDELSRGEGFRLDGFSCERRPQTQPSTTSPHLKHAAGVESRRFMAENLKARPYRTPLVQTKSLQHGGSRARDCGCGKTGSLAAPALATEADNLTDSANARRFECPDMYRVRADNALEVTLSGAYRAKSEFKRANSILTVLTSRSVCSPKSHRPRLWHTIRAIALQHPPVHAPRQIDETSAPASSPSGPQSCGSLTPPPTNSPVWPRARRTGTPETRPRICALNATIEESCTTASVAASTTGVAGVCFAALVSRVHRSVKNVIDGICASHALRTSGTRTRPTRTTLDAPDVGPTRILDPTEPALRLARAGHGIDERAESLKDNGLQVRDGERLASSCTYNMCEYDAAATFRARRRVEGPYVNAAQVHWQWQRRAGRGTGHPTAEASTRLGGSSGDSEEGAGKHNTKRTPLKQILTPHLVPTQSTNATKVHRRRVTPIHPPSRAAMATATKTCPPSPVIRSPRGLDPDFLDVHGRLIRLRSGTFCISEEGEVVGQYGAGQQTRPTVFAPYAPRGGATRVGAHGIAQVTATCSESNTRVRSPPTPSGCPLPAVGCSPQGPDPRFLDDTRALISSFECDHFAQENRPRRCVLAFMGGLEIELAVRIVGRNARGPEQPMTARDAALTPAPKTRCRATRSSACSRAGSCQQAWGPISQATIWALIGIREYIGFARRTGRADDVLAAVRTLAIVFASELRRGIRKVLLREGPLSEARRRQMERRRTFCDVSAPCCIVHISSDERQASWHTVIPAPVTVAVCSHRVKDCIVNNTQDLLFMQSNRADAEDNGRHDGRWPMKFDGTGEKMSDPSTEQVSDTSSPPRCPIRFAWPGTCSAIVANPGPLMRPSRVASHRNLSALPSRATILPRSGLQCTDTRKRCQASIVLKACALWLVLLHPPASPSPLLLVLPSPSFPSAPLICSLCKRVVDMSGGRYVPRFARSLVIGPLLLIGSYSAVYGFMQGSAGNTFWHPARAATLHGCKIRLVFASRYERCDTAEFPFSTYSRYELMHGSAGNTFWRSQHRCWSLRQHSGSLANLYAELPLDTYSVCSFVVLSGNGQHQVHWLRGVLFAQRVLLRIRPCGVLSRTLLFQKEPAIFRAARGLSPRTAAFSTASLDCNEMRCCFRVHDVWPEIPSSRTRTTVSCSIAALRHDSNERKERVVLIPSTMEQMYVCETQVRAGIDNLEAITDLKEEMNKREQQKKNLRMPSSGTSLDGKRLPGEVEIHQNGLRYHSPMGTSEIGYLI
ncbi:hypothetical protein EVG20_g7296 [Dentipellis fragilis]|uniref:Uncharacterized protein n=1 Tax=Dentipellis fragilis TaxID=205917 RepID=A0A4Y9YFK6_9AGAM|nr:hypothetical protein EVG20_g7296 [Dentipellis fragilis]